MLKPISDIKVDLGINPGGKVQKFLTQTCYNHMDKYVPRDTGALRSNVVLKTNSITYQSPYAHYQYIGNKYVMDNGKSAYYSDTYGFWSKPGAKKTDSGQPLIYHTAGTGPYWDKRMVSAEINDVVKEVTDYMRKDNGKD